MQIKKVSKEFAEKVLRKGSHNTDPEWRGLFLARNTDGNSIYMAVDSSTPHTFIEFFDDRREAESWLRREFETDDLDRAKKEKTCWWTTEQRKACKQEKRMLSIVSNMTTYIRAVVSDEEKENIRQRAQELGLNEAQIIRQGLKKMGVSIEVEKSIGVSPVNRGNPYGQGGKAKSEEIERHREQIVADYEAGMTLDALAEKYPISRATIAGIVPKGARKPGVKAKADK